MNRSLGWMSGVLATALAVLPGCLWRDRESMFSDDAAAHFTAIASEIETPDVEPSSSPDTLGALAPLTIRNDQPTEYWDLSLEEAVQTAIANSQVLRDLGGAVIRSPGSIGTVYGPATVDTDPRFGVDAALSAFDAQFNVITDFANNDRALNNELLGGGTRLLKQELFNMRTELLKRSATGGEFAVRKNIGYDANNAPSNLFPHAYNANLEFEARQPLLQGAGSLFNRIAGAEVNGRNRNLARFPGDYNGVLIARINTDVQIADLEMGLRDLVSNVENTYWDLYFAYRDLNAKIAARDAALETWRRVHALFEANRRGGEAEKEAQAREQYYQFQEEVENALTGRLLDGTRTNNGSRGGTFRGVGGVHVVERRLRLLMGISLSDGRLVRPSDEPALVRVALDWPEVVTESLCRRAELRRQKWIIKRRELELIASRNFLMPRLDAFGQYRFRGFGEDLIDNNTGGNQRFDNAYQDLTTGDFQEWQLGLEFSLPIGFRQGHAGVRNAELLLSRERAVLKEQERQIVHDLADAVAEMERAFAVAQTAYNRRLAAQEQLEAVGAAFDADKAPLDQVLTAQRRVADSEERYHRALVEYALAVKNIHFEKGSLLDHNQVFLAEGPWPGKAYFDAARREKWRGKERMNFALHMTPPLSKGTVQQEALPPSAALELPEGEEIPLEAVPADALPADGMPVETSPGEAQQPEDVMPLELPGSTFKDDPLAPPEEMPAGEPQPMPPVQPTPAEPFDADLPEFDPPNPAAPKSVLPQDEPPAEAAPDDSILPDFGHFPRLRNGLRLPLPGRPLQAAANPPLPDRVRSLAPLKPLRNVLHETITTVAVLPSEFAEEAEAAAEAAPSQSEPPASGGLIAGRPVRRMLLRMLPGETSTMTTHEDIKLKTGISPATADEAQLADAEGAAERTSRSEPAATASSFPKLIFPTGESAVKPASHTEANSRSSNAITSLGLRPTTRDPGDKPTRLRR